MHSKIFQFSRTPVPENDFITPDSIPEYFTYSIADYTDDCNEYRTENHQWLADYMQHRQCAKFNFSDQQNPTITFAEDAAINYFAQQYEDFCSTLKHLSENLSLELFATRTLEWDIYGLKDYYDDKFGFYVVLSNEDYEDEFLTLDSFMRSEYANGTYYLGGVVDYHF